MNLRFLDWTDEENAENNGLQNEDLIVWMRTAALPNFRSDFLRLVRETAAVEALDSFLLMRHAFALWIRTAALPNFRSGLYV